MADGTNDLPIQTFNLLYPAVCCCAGQGPKVIDKARRHSFQTNLYQPSNHHLPFFRRRAR